jgi:acyl-CoA thioester hydrolase
MERVMSESQPPAEPGQINGYFEGAVHVQPIRIYYEDTDASGIVYNANYVKFIERGRTNFLRLIGVHHQDLRALENPIAFTVTRLELAYKKPARLDDLVMVYTQYTKLTGARIFGSQIIKRDGITLMEAQIQAACINFEGKPRRLPAYVREAMALKLAGD